MTATIPAARRVLLGCLFLGCLVLGALAAPVSAELVVFADGGFLRVESYAVRGKKVRLELPSGGAMVIPIERIGRIVDDAPAKIRREIVDPPAFVLRFDPEQEVPEGPYGELIHRTAERHGLNPELVTAVIRAESSFRPKAVSVKGARGLMQLMPATAERFGLDPARAFEPDLNLDAGCRYLRFLADRFDDDLPRVLAAYNAGEGTVDRYDGVPPYRETRNYLKRIFKRLGLDLHLEKEDARRADRQSL